MCLPFFRRLYLCGEEQAPNAFLSSLQTNVEPASSALKRKVAFRFFVFFFGPLSIVVCGAVVSAGGCGVADSVNS